MDTSITHSGVTCDECRVSPINGIRFKCGNCSDYDICNRCFNSTSHNNTHVFIQIKKPLDHVERTPLLTHNLYLSTPHARTPTPPFDPRDIMLD